jgi:hypothetical protein
VTTGLGVVPAQDETAESIDPAVKVFLSERSAVHDCRAAIDNNSSSKAWISRGCYYMGSRILHLPTRLGMSDMGEWYVGRISDGRVWIEGIREGAFNANSDTAV